VEVRDYGRGPRGCSLGFWRAAYLAMWAIVGMGCASPPSTLADAGLPAPDAPLVGDILCLSMHLPLGDSDEDRIERARQLDHVEALGVRMVRRDVHWHKVEPAPGELHWDQVEAGITEIHTRGLELLALLAYGVPWATTATDDDTAYPPDDPADFARFAAAVAQRYADRVHLFEIWNEPNNGWRFWKPTVGGDPAAYGALLRASHAAIHQVHDAATVIYAGTVFHENVVLPSATQFLADHFAAWPDAAQDFDALGFHPYPWYPPVVPPEEQGAPEMPFTRMAEELRAVLADHGAADKPLYATEFGWPSFGDVTQQQQAAWLVRGTLWLAAVGARAACWYTLGDGASTGTAPPEGDFGLLSWDLAAGAPGPPKPAYHALQTLSSTLGDTGFVRDDSNALGLAPGGHALVFAARDGHTRVYVLWTVYDEVTLTALVPTAGDAVTTFDALGVTQPHTREAGAVAVEVRSLPLYVVLTPAP
jgi:hypothetical protein